MILHWWEDNRSINLEIYLGNTVNEVVGRRLLFWINDSPKIITQKGAVTQGTTLICALNAFRIDL